MEGWMRGVGFKAIVFALLAVAGGASAQTNVTAPQAPPKFARPAGAPDPSKGPPAPLPPKVVLSSDALAKIKANEAPSHAAQAIFVAPGVGPSAPAKASGSPN